MSARPLRGDVCAGARLYWNRSLRGGQFYLTTRRYDTAGIIDAGIIEAPNDLAMARIALALGAQGNVRTETMRAFTENEYRNLVGELP